MAKKQFKYPVARGTPLTYRMKNNCLWCRYGERPDIKGPGICEACVHRHKNMLCSTKWKRARIAFLGIVENAICQRCKAKGYIEPSSEINHIHPWRWFPDLFWESRYWEGICRTCHQIETNEHHGGAGNPVNLATHPPEIEPD